MRRVASNLAKLPRLLSKQNEKWKKPDGDGGTHLVAGLLPGPFEGGPMMGEPINHENSTLPVTLMLRRPVTCDDAAELTCRT